MDERVRHRARPRRRAAHVDPRARGDRAVDRRRGDRRRAGRRTLYGRLAALGRRHGPRRTDAGAARAAALRRRRPCHASRGSRAGPRGTRGRPRRTGPRVASARRARRPGAPRRGRAAGADRHRNAAARRKSRRAIKSNDLLAGTTIVAKGKAKSVGKAAAQNRSTSSNRSPCRSASPSVIDHPKRTPPQPPRFSRNDQRSRWTATPRKTPAT